MKKTVLVVDDDLEVGQALARELGRVFEVLVALGFEEGVSLLAGHTDICGVVSDYHLGPGRDGADLLATARAGKPGVARILVTGSPMADELARRILNSGVAHRLLAKPWRRGEVLRELERAVSA